MNELDFMIRELGNVVVDIEEFDFESHTTNDSIKLGGEVKQLRDLVNKKEKLLKEIIEYKKKQ